MAGLRYAGLILREGNGFRHVCVKRVRHAFVDADAVGSGLGRSDGVDWNVLYEIV